MRVPRASDGEETPVSLNNVDGMNAIGPIETIETAPIGAESIDFSDSAATDV
jgi:hypothetical protein